ncbi:hypothetical protein [Burkholderia sp. Ac-20353]|uniref:hypothetical protein n=1 Tax=Burkholderia sp. Ac-20353 TaxID=2703894 RepID=UPI00197CAF8C|nr:hypothetical protein [Burkholderia sp. Ac-20353]MBN3791436.1 hypothetical protein [Burkholderia sp. Ac-20353]
MQVDPQVVVKAEHQPTPNATIIALMSGVSASVGCGRNREAIQQRGLGVEYFALTINGLR